MTNYYISDDEYKQQILDTCNKIMKEKLYKIVKRRKINKKKPNYKIKLLRNEWLMEMDEDLKTNVIYNLNKLCKTTLILYDMKNFD